MGFFYEMELLTPMRLNVMIIETACKNDDLNTFLTVQHIDEPTLLRLAASYGSPSIVRYLLRRGNDPEEVNEDGFSAIFLARCMSYDEKQERFDKTIQLLERYSRK